MQDCGLEELGIGVEAGSHETNAPYVIKYSRKSRLARLHLRDGCTNARDARIGLPVFEIGEQGCAYNAVCHHCWPRGTGPLQDCAGEGEQEPASGSGSESESSSSDASMLN